MGFAGLALLRAYPLGSRTKLIREIELKLNEEGWLDDEIEIEEFDSEVGYQHWAETYDSLPNPLIELEEPVLHSMIDGRRAGTAVDAACGTGRLTAYLIDRGHHVIAVDPSEAMLAKAREIASGADFRSGSLLDLPVADGTADLVVCALALAHFEELERPVLELARIVKPGGHILLSDIHPLPVATGAHAFFRTGAGRRAMVRNHVHWPSQYLRAFRAANLRLVDCVEPVITDLTLDKISGDSPTRHWAEQALLGLPFALIWELERADAT